MSKFDLGVVYGYLHAINAPEHILEAAESLKELAVEEVFIPEDHKPIPPEKSFKPGSEGLIITGKTCNQCGTSERYAINSKCVWCAREARNKSEAARSRRIKESHIVIGAECKACGGTERYASNMQCVACIKASQKKGYEQKKDLKQIRLNGKNPNWDFSSENVEMRR